MSGAPLRRAQPTPGVPAPADKRFRRSSHRPGRRRPWQLFAMRMGLLVGAIAVTAGLLWMSGNAAMDARLFRVDRLSVEGNRRLSAADVDTLLAGLRGESIFRADLEEYRGRLLDSPWVQEAEMWRVLPSSVQIVLTERVPLAIARRNGRFHLVDRLGVIDDAGPEYGEFDLPIVDGLFLEGSGTTPDPGRIEVLDRLLAEIATRADLRDRLSQVDLSDARNAVVLLDGEPARLQLGTTQFVERLQRYIDAYEATQRRVAVVDYYDLRFEDRIFVGPARMRRDDKQ